MYSLLNDVIAMKKQMGQMDSIMQELAHYKNSSLGNNNNKNVYLFSHWDNYNYSLIIPILVPILKDLNIIYTVNQNNHNANSVLCNIL